MKFTLKIPATVLALVLFPGLALAQSGQVTGTLDGQPLDFTASDGVGGMPTLFYETYGGSGYSGLGIIASALEQSGDSINGVMIFMDFESESSFSPSDVTLDMVVDTVIMVVDAWDAGSQNPERVWLAKLDGFQSLGIDQLDLEGDAGALSGRITSDSFCLHDMSRGDPPVPIVQDDAAICQTGTVDFTMASDTTKAAPPEQPMEVDVLGQMTGAVGDAAYDWITFVANGVQPTATFDGSGALDMISLQAHSPESADFLRDDILSIDIAAEVATGRIVEGESLSAGVHFFPAGREAYYTTDSGAAQVTATIIGFSHRNGQSEIAMTLEGQICRIEGLTEVPNDCKSFAAEGVTELVDAPDD